MAQTIKRTTATGEKRYDVRTRIAGRVVTRTFKRRKDADAYATTVAADKLRGVAIDPRRAQVTFTDYAKQWMENREDLAQRTVDLHWWLLRRHIEPTFGTSALADLSPSAVRSWNARIAGKRPSNAAKAYRLLSSMMRAAVDDEIIGRNPCRVKGAGGENAPERPVATIAEVQALADAMRDHLRVSVLLAAWCQLRRGEILGLHRRDVDLLRGTLTITTTRGPSMSGKEIVKAPKTDAGRRTVAVPSNMLPALTDHLDRHAEADLQVFVFDVTGRALGLAWDKARRSTGRPDLHFHDLRHSGLTWSAATGATTAELMRRAGHASTAAALRYQHATEDRDRALADALAGLAADAPVVPFKRAIGAR